MPAHTSQYTWPLDWPKGCPPNDAKPANEVVFRLCKTNPPTEEDFKTFRELERSGGDEVMAAGVSVMLHEHDAAHHLKLFPRSKNRFISRAKLSPELGVTKQTPTNNFPSHLTWWPTQGLTRSTYFSVISE